MNHKDKLHMNLRPLRDYIIVLPKEAPEKTSGGLFLTSTSKEKPSEGEVLSVGPGKYLESGARRKPEVEVGMDVIYGKYAGTEFDESGTKYLIIHEDDILAILPPRS